MDKYNLQISFYKYLSYHSQCGIMMGIKRIIYKNYKLSDNQFERLLWRANRVLFNKREYDLIRSLSNDESIQNTVYNNYTRQESYFLSEIMEILEINKISLSDISLKNKESFSEKRLELKNAINTALYPKKNPELDRNKAESRFWNSGSYFID